MRVELITETEFGNEKRTFDFKDLSKENQYLIFNFLIAMEDLNDYNRADL